MKGIFNNRRGLGVEIEFLVPRGTEISCWSGSLNTVLAEKIAGHQELIDSNTTCKAEKYNHTTKTYWKIVSDVSVKGDSTYTGNHEIVSPILYGKNGKQQLKAVLQVLREQNCKVNRTCGIHVHHDVTELMLAGRRVAKKFLKNICLFVVKYEHIIYKLLPQSRQSEMYSQPARNKIGGLPLFRCLQQNVDAKKNVKYTITHNVDSDDERHYSECGSNFGTVKSGIQHGSEKRYSGLNLQNIWTRGSVEFRYMQGSLNFNKIWSWVVLTQAIVNTNEKASRVVLTDIQSNEHGFFHLRKSLGLIGYANRCVETRFANKWTKIKWGKFSTNGSYALNTVGYYGSTVTESL